MLNNTSPNPYLKNRTNTRIPTNHENSYHYDTITVYSLSKQLAILLYTATHISPVLSSLIVIRYLHDIYDMTEAAKEDPFPELLLETKNKIIDWITPDDDDHICPTGENGTCPVDA